MHPPLAALDPRVAALMKPDRDRVRVAESVGSSHERIVTVLIGR
jgi:hypothetical protein